MINSTCKSSEQCSLLLHVELMLHLRERKSDFTSP